MIKMNKLQYGEILAFLPRLARLDKPGSWLDLKKNKKQLVRNTFESGRESPPKLLLPRAAGD